MGAEAEKRPLAVNEMRTRVGMIRPVRALSKPTWSS
jgi:hypothetical protein